MSLTTNVLIIGRSGVGKSSLLNYLFGQEVEAVGAGAPVTKKGINAHNCNLSEDFSVCVYDTWGLEPGRNDAWYELISGEIAKHDAASLQDWFHTIIYCVNAGLNRIEDFELDLMKGLIDDGNHLVVAFTHADIAGADQVIEAYRNRLGDADLSMVDIVPVCSVEKKLIGGGGSKAYGREELLQFVRKGLWEKIVARIPSDAIKKAEKKINFAEKTCKDYINHNIKFFKIYSDKQYEEIADYIREVLEDCIKGYHEMYMAEIFTGYRYFTDICEKFMAVNMDAAKKETELPQISLDFKQDNMAKVSNAIATASYSLLIPGAVFVIPFAVKDNQKKRCMEILNIQISNMRDNLYKDETMLRDMLTEMIPMESFEMRKD